MATSSIIAVGTPSLAEVMQAGAIRTLFQPIVDLETGHPVAAEALTRGPAGTWLETPDALFAEAAAQRSTTRLDQLCIQRSLRAARARTTDRLGIFVNVEPTTFAHPATSRLLMGLGDRLVIEVTERHLAYDPASVLSCVDRARATGARIALDDVGANPASTAFLAFVQPDVVKLDLSVIQAPPSAAIGQVATAVMAYAERHGALILAEGIETAAHLHRARALGARLGQGYYFGRPGPDMPNAPSGSDLDSVLRSETVAIAPQPTPFTAVEKREVAVGRADVALLLEISRHLELQAARQSDLVLLGAFQDADRFTPATARRYEQLARCTAFVAALGVGLGPEPAPGVRGATLADDDPLRGEWAVIAISPHYAGALIARDLGDHGPRRNRRFDYVVTHDRSLVTVAALAAMQRVTATARA